MHMNFHLYLFLKTFVGIICFEHKTSSKMKVCGIRCKELPMEIKGANFTGTFVKN